MKTDTELKAKAFDILMEAMMGNHRAVGSKRVAIKPSRRPSLDPAKVANVKYKDVHVYEWVLRNDGSSDLRQSLLDEAAQQLKGE